MRKTITFFEKIYKISINNKKRQELVWRDLKSFFNKMGYNYGVFEKEMMIRAVFKISENKALDFNYYIEDGSLHFKSFLIAKYNPEIASDIFILASHFNNILKDFVVIICPDKCIIELKFKIEIFSSLIYPEKKIRAMYMHHEVSNIAYLAFKRLINEREEPAIIFADVMKNRKN